VTESFVAISAYKPRDVVRARQLASTSPRVPLIRRSWSHCFAASIEDAYNIVFVGGPWTGKTHRANAIAVQATQHHRLRVRFLSNADLVNALEQDELGR